MDFDLTEEQGMLSKVAIAKCAEVVLVFRKC